MDKRYIASCDVGGTMTDLFVVDQEGNFVVGKAPTTRQDQSVGFLNSLSNALSYWNLDLDKQAGEVLPRFDRIVYSGTTILNTLITRSGKKVGLITTKGYEHNLVEGRCREAVAGYTLADIHHFVYRVHKEPLIPVRRIRGVTERIGIRGEIVIPLYEHEVAPAVEELLDEGIEGLVVCLLCSFANPLHEKRVAELAREVMTKRDRDLPVYLSHDIAPTIREVSRLNSAVISAYAAEPTRGQLVRIESMLQEKGFAYPLQIGLSYGTTSTTRYRRIYEATASGPIGGVVGASYLGALIGAPNVVTTDMGGTSLDFGVVTQGAYRLVRESSLQRMFVNLPTVETHSIGAGSGTYIRLDPYTKRVMLGPDSAAGDPGPVYYDKGNETPTVGDCDLILGYLDPDNYLGGRMSVNKDKALSVFKEKVADPLKLGVYEAAEGVVDLMNNAMGNALRGALVGLDVSEYVLLGYGGASGMHLAGYAGDLPWKGIATVPWAAAFSAFGCCCMRYAHRLTRSVDFALPYHAPEAHLASVVDGLSNVWHELEEEACRDFAAEGVDREKLTFAHFTYMQYLGQLDDVEVVLPVYPLRSTNDVEQLIAEFERVYGATFPMVAKFPEAGFRILEAGLLAEAPGIKPLIRESALAGKAPAVKAIKAKRTVYFGRQFREAAIFDLDALQPGNEVAGLAILEGPAYTILVPSDRMASIDRHRVIWLNGKGSK